MIKEVIYKCAVNGSFKGVNFVGATVYGICGFKKCGSNSLCGAHGNYKCEHKYKVVEIPEVTK